MVDVGSVNYGNNAGTIPLRPDIRSSNTWKKLSRSEDGKEVLRSFAEEFGGQMGRATEADLKKYAKQKLGSEKMQALAISNNDYENDQDGDGGEEGIGAAGPADPQTKSDQAYIDLFYYQLLQQLLETKPTVDQRDDDRKSREAEEKKMNEISYKKKLEERIQMAKRALKKAADQLNQVLAGLKNLQQLELAMGRKITGLQEQIGRVQGLLNGIQNLSQELARVAIASESDSQPAGSQAVLEQIEDGARTCRNSAEKTDQWLNQIRREVEKT